jgi:hypothetical protein
MTAPTDNLVEQVRDFVDVPELTALASGNPQEKPFLLEALALQGVLLLLEHYCGAYLNALGVDDLAKRHADASRRLLARLRGRRDHAPTDEDKVLVAEAVERLRKDPEDVDARRRAEEAVGALLLESGVGSARSRELAKDISTVVVPPSDG